MNKTEQRKQFGTIQERLKYLITLTNKYELPSDVHHAIFDLADKISRNKG